MAAQTATGTVESVPFLGTTAASAAGSRSTFSTMSQCPFLQRGQRLISMAATRRIKVSIKVPWCKAQVYTN
jgi:hypothetical protein